MFGVEEVIVTGTAVAERTKFESSVAISTFNAEDIAQQAPASSADLISAVPGFWVESTAGTTQGNVFARGIIQDGGYRYVGLMEDGIPIYPVFELSFYNPDQFVRVDETIERVEALRGGTAPIFTAGAVGGTINFVTQSPDGCAARRIQARRQRLRHVSQRRRVERPDQRRLGPRARWLLSQRPMAFATPVTPPTKAAVPRQAGPQVR